MIVLRSLVAATFALHAFSADVPTVETAYTIFQGTPSTEPGVQFFGGIRYAQPPLGDLRWRAPQALDESPPARGVAKNVTDASAYGNICLQQPGTLDWNGQSDDCLFLNVFKPEAAKKGSKLPVVLYIHGGGNYGASARAFPLDKWVRVSNGTVVGVNIQYRLGLLGFLSSHMVLEAGLANAGLHDQRAALQWVHRNIAAFGGDPNHITVSGESAGGGDIVYHLTAYGGTKPPLFQAAIPQSIGTDPVLTPDVYEVCFQAVLNSTGCNTTLDDSAATMACLRSLPLSALVTAVNTKPSTCKYTPIIDGPDGLIPAHASTLLREGRFLRMPVMPGSTTDDGAGFAGNPSGIVNTTEGFIANLRKRYVTLSDASAARMVELYPADKFNSTWSRAAAAWGDTIFTCQDWFIADKVRSLGERRAFTYRWATPDPVRLAASSWAGAMHTSDLFFLSGPDATHAVTKFNPLNDTETALAEEAMGYWTSFARAFNPSTHRLSTAPAWPALGSQSLRMVIDEGDTLENTDSHVEQITEDHKERCRFWNEIGPEIGL
ncbi:carboxyesterase [Auriculariales sp. MPI-PUGE-AT-0066]|nr:carboxyesterase [Auriculariales sp. MPI-PUGE-AT-0066]